MKRTLILILFLPLLFIGCDTLEEVLNSGGGLTREEIVNGLKEALEKGTEEAVRTLSRENGFYLDPQVKIPFPPEVQYVADKLEAIGLSSLVNDFVERMNHAAEKAVTKAAPIFFDALRQMTIADAVNILNGNDHAATDYFRSKTYEQLVSSFKPEISSMLNTMHVSDYWTKVTRAYNKLPFTKKVETDLPQYVTEKAIDGLFVKVAGEEKKIREDPAARTTALLKKVFAQAGHAIVQ